MKLTNADFAQQCAYIAKEASAWAGDALTLPELCNEYVRAADVARFTDNMRSRLDHLDRVAGRASLSTDRGERDGE